MWRNNFILLITLLMVGCGLEPDNEQKMQSLYTNLDYTELTTCGHFIHMEQAEMFNEKLKEFIFK